MSLPDAPATGLGEQNKASLRDPFSRPGEVALIGSKSGQGQVSHNQGGGRKFIAKGRKTLSFRQGNPEDSARKSGRSGSLQTKGGRKLQPAPIPVLRNQDFMGGEALLMKPFPRINGGKEGS
jgi:hypothetical protein